MALQDLLFKDLPQATPPVVLVFGEWPFDTPLPNADCSIAAALPALAGAVCVAIALRVDGAATLPGLAGAVVCAQDMAAQRPLVAQVHAGAQVAQAVRSGVRHPAQITRATTAGATTPAQEAMAVASATIARAQDAARTARQAKAAFTQALGAPTLPQAVLWQAADPRARPAVQSPFAQGVRGGTAVQGVRWQEGLRDRHAHRLARAQVAQAVPPIYTKARAQPAKALLAARLVRMQDAMHPAAGVSPYPTRPTPAPLVDWATALLFACPPLVYPALVFGAKPCVVLPTGGATLVILPARFYMIAFNVFAQRLPDGAEVPLFDATVSIDVGSFCWALSASAPAGVFEQLSPTSTLPVQLRVTMGGVPWVFAVDGLARTHSFGQQAVRIQGRSVTALLGAPYMPVTTRNNAYAATAQQLALQALDGTGVDLDWGLTDWLVSAGAWSHQGTPLQAVQQIASAAGGFVQSHKSAAQLLTRHPYAGRAGDLPGAPWGWAQGAADVELAPDALITTSTQRRDASAYNAIYVSGTTAGVLAHVKRTGTAGDVLAPMQTDALITHADAARQRALSVLGATGAQHDITLELPILSGAGQPGVLEVGQLVQVNTTTPWRGRVRAVSVAAKRPSLRQTITLEHHLEAA
jgi:hypothetical protein